MIRKCVAVMTVVLASGFVPGAARADCTPGVDGCLPEASDCATGSYNGAWLGRQYGAGAVCLGAGGIAIVYAGGNPAHQCGSIVGFNVPVAEQGANACQLEVGDNDIRYRVQLPADYESTTTRYPVLYLLPGGGGDENSWFRSLDLAEIADQGLIVVSPFNGIGMYNDWRNGRYQMESVIIDGLIPHVDATYRTLANRAHRAIAGFSQGGYGAMFLPARHPELFSVAASFSGVLDIRDTWWLAATGYQIDTAGYGEVQTDNPIFGNYVTDEVWWRDRNTLDLVTNLRGIDLSIFTGNGLPGEYDGPADVVFDGGGEASSHREAEAFTKALRAAAIPYAYEVHDGLHWHLYAADSLRAWTPVMLSKLGAQSPETFDYRTVESSFSAYDWTFTTDPARAPEFMEVSDASVSGITLAGSGLTTVTTAPIFEPGASVALDGATATSALADPEGRITFTVDLGSPHPFQQYGPQATLAAQQPRTGTVSFEF